MDDIYYLVHTTNKYKNDWTEMRPSKLEEDQYPGVYLTLITKHNIRDEMLYGGKQILIFSKRLLEQRNYHINVKDDNGRISEHNTYFPWNLDEAVRKIKDNAAAAKETNFSKDLMNEVVFHDPIPMDYLCLVMHKLSPYVLSNDILPPVVVENDIEPDMTKLPFYCYALGHEGEESSREFYVKIANMCNIDNRLSTDEIILKIKEQMPNLYTHRIKQNLNALKKAGGKYARKTRKTRRAFSR
jgi:hypothetical protein